MAATVSAGRSGDKTSAVDRPDRRHDYDPGEAGGGGEVVEVVEAVEAVQAGVDAGLPDGWATIDGARFGLGAGEWARSSVRLHPPRHHATRPGRMAFDLVAWSSTNQNVRCTERRHLVVSRYRDARARLEPAPGAGRRAGVYQLVVANDGNAPLHGAVEVGDPEQALHVLCQARDLTVPPGEQAAIEVRAVPRQPIRLGRAVVHRVRVLVSSPGEPPLVAEATFTQRPLLRPSR